MALARPRLDSLLDSIPGAKLAVSSGADESYNVCVKSK